MNPPVRECSFSGAHRLIPSKYSTEGTVLAELADNEREVQELVELDGATNARLLGEEGLLPGIGVHELLYGVAYSQIVNASFTHAAPQGGRFNNNRRGAWYAGLERETSIAEVAFHKLEQLREVDWKFEEVSTCDDYLADFAAEFHDLRGVSSSFRKYLKPSRMSADRMASFIPASAAKAEPALPASGPCWFITCVCPLALNSAFRPEKSSLSIRFAK